MTSTSTITILRASEPLTKTHTKGGGDSIPVTTPFNQSILWYGVEERPVASIDELHEVLAETITDNRAGIVRDVLSAEAREAIAEGCLLQVPGRQGAVVRSNGQIRRLKHDPDASTFGTLEVKAQHWLAFDVDTIESEDLHIRDRPIEAVRFVVENFLPEAFHGATCVYHWTSSAGVKDFTTVKVRLWFWLSEPASSADLKRLCLDLGLKVDAAIFNPIQLHFTATPVFVGMEDPMPQRLGIIRGASDIVVLPDAATIAPQSHGSTKAPLSADRSWSAGLDLEACLAKIGDGPGQNGFDAPTFAAALKWAAQTHPSMLESQRPHVRAKIIAAVEAAHKNKGRNVADYTNGKKIDQKLDAAIAYAQKDRAEAADDFADDISEDDLAVAQERVAEAIHKAISSAVAWCEDNAKATDAALGEIVLTPPPQTAVLAQVGIGKTDALLKALARHADALGSLRVAIYLPDNNLSGEVLKRAKEVFPNSIKVRLHRGRMDERLGPTPCDPSMHEAARIVEELRGSVKDDLCATCRFGEKCTWLAQHRDTGPGVTILPFTYALLPGAERFDFAVFDEGFITSLISDRPVKLANLDPRAPIIVPAKTPKKARKRKPVADAQPQTPEEAAAAAKEALEALEAAAREAEGAALDLMVARQKLWDATAGGTRIPSVSELLAVGIDAGVAEEARTLEYRRLGVRPSLKGLSLEQMRAVAAGFGAASADASNMANIWRCLQDQLGMVVKSDWDDTNGGDTIIVREQLNGLRFGLDKDKQPSIFAGRRKRLLCDKKPILVLDATGDADLLRLAVPDLGDVVRVRAKAPHARVIQVVDQRFGKRATCPHDTDDEAAKARKERKRQRVAETVEAFAAGKTAGLLSYKAVEEELAGSLPNNVIPGHFGLLRGQNTWERVAVLAVVGRVLPQADEVERQTGALFYDQPQAIGQGFGIAEARAWHRMRDGAPLEGRREVHPDPWCEKLRRQITEAELEQSIGRARAVRRTADDPVTILVFGQVPLACAVDQLVTFEDVKAHAGDLFAARHGIEPGNPAHLHAIAPELFPSLEAARSMVRRGQAGSNRSIYLNLQNDPAWTAHQYQLAGARQQEHPLRFDPARVTDIATWFEAYLGQPLITIKGKMRSSEAPDHCEAEVEAAYPAAPPQRRFICDAPHPGGVRPCMGRPLVYISPNDRQLQRHNRRVSGHAQPGVIFIPKTLNSEGLISCSA